LIFITFRWKVRKGGPQQINTTECPQRSDSLILWRGHRQAPLNSTIMEDSDMGLLDSLLRSGAVGELAKRVINDPRVIEAASSMLSPDDDRVGTGNGGLGGVLGSLRDAGLGGAADSWVGQGQNQPISANDLEAALGRDTMRQFSERAGVQERDAPGVLADLLPELVNQLTPRGDVPKGSALGGLLGQLIARR
jgi:uncharacterized protein YidB (DUF937 family)